MEPQPQVALCDKYLLEKPKTVMEIAASILPRDDSSLQWSEPNGGFTEDPAATLEQLYTGGFS